MEFRRIDVENTLRRSVFSKKSIISADIRRWKKLLLFGKKPMILFFFRIFKKTKGGKDEFAKNSQN